MCCGNISHVDRRKRKLGCSWEFADHQVVQDADIVGNTRIRMRKKRKRERERERERKRETDRERER